MGFSRAKVLAYVTIGGYVASAGTLTSSLLVPGALNENIGTRLALAGVGVLGYAGLRVAYRVKDPFSRLAAFAIVFR